MDKNQENVLSYSNMICYDDTAMRGSSSREMYFNGPEFWRCTVIVYNNFIKIKIFKIRLIVFESYFDSKEIILKNIIVAAVSLGDPLEGQPVSVTIILMVLKLKAIKAK